MRVFQSGVDGVIISNTTITRPDSLQSSNKAETGGLSGAPVKQLSTEVIRDMYALFAGKFVYCIIMLKLIQLSQSSQRHE